MKKRSAFTLLEVLIVIMIVSILAAMAVSSYGVTRQQAKLDIALDTLISFVKRQQSLAKSGREGKSLVEDSALSSSRSQFLQPTCYGVLFDTLPRANEKSIQLVEAPYVAVRSQQADFCDVQRAKLTPFEQMENLVLREITHDQNSVEKFALLFKPPFGRPSLTSADFLQKLEAVSITVTLGTTIVQDKDKRTLEMNLASGLVQRKSNL